MQRILKELGIDPTTVQLIARTKTAGSIFKKLADKGPGYALSEMTDCLGGRVIVADLEELTKLSNYLRTKYQILEYRDYYFNPLPRDRYRAQHLIIDLDGRNPLELQLTTRLSVLQNELHHDVVYKREVYGNILSENHRAAVTEFCERVLLYELLEYAQALEYAEIEKTVEEVYQGFQDRVEKMFAEEERKAIYLAFDLAKEIHAAELRRDTGQPYIIHLLRTTNKLLEKIAEFRETGRENELDDYEVVIASLLHDAKETSLEKLDFTTPFRARVENPTNLLAKKQAGMEELSNGGYYGKLRTAEDEAVRWLKVFDRLDNIYSIRAVRDPLWVREYLEETEKYTLPLALQTDLKLASQMESASLFTRFKL